MMNYISRTNDVNGREGWNIVLICLPAQLAKTSIAVPIPYLSRRIDPDIPNHEVYIDELSDANPPSRDYEANSTGMNKPIYFLGIADM